MQRLAIIAFVICLTLPVWAAKQAAGNRMPAIDHPGQDAAAQKRLRAVEKRTGRKPNILVLIVDDLGWADIGVYGGGEAIGWRER